MQTTSSRLMQQAVHGVAHLASQSTASAHSRKINLLRMIDFLLARRYAKRSLMHGVLHQAPNEG